MPTFYGYVDLSKNELRNAVVQNLGSAPGTPVKGQIYMDSTGNNLYFYDGSGWVSCRSAGALTPAASVTTSAVGDAATVGASTNYARQDHAHGREAFGAITAETAAFGSASANGSAATVAHSDHTHGNPAHTGAIHNVVQINQLSAPVVDVSWNGLKLTFLGDPTTGTDAANKQYVDNLVAGLSWKDSVRVATTANLAALSGNQTIDGVATATNDRVLVKNQTTPSANGIYMTQPGAWTRTADADAAAEIEGMATFVMEGTTQGDTSWVCTTNAPIVVGTTNLTFAQFSGGGTVTGGAGLTLTGNVLDVVAGDTSLTVAADSVAVNTGVIATVASLGGYTPTTRTVTAGAGLTGGGDLSANRTIDVVATDTTLTVAADSVGVNTAVIATVASVTAGMVGVAKKFAAALTGTASPETVTHNLNTRDITLTVLNGATPYTAVEVDWDATTVNTAVVRYSPNLGAGYRVVVTG